MPFWSASSSLRAPQDKKMFSDNILLVFKDRKSVTKNNDYWTDKLKQVTTLQFFLNDHLSLTNEEIIKSINFYRAICINSFV